MQFNQKITPCLWFDGKAEEAANFYVGIFKNSKIVTIARYPKAGQETHQSEPGSVMTVSFELAGMLFTALNGPPIFKFTEAVSLQIFVDDQKEYDHYWDRLTPGGDPRSQVCGWLKDKYGLSWQVTPKKMLEWFTKPGEKTERAFAAMMKMGRLDIAALERAYNG
jgi:predicted 3-demethylubiquinone-9 3-methyltransferase (glyoxalase superfamily)